MNNRKQYILDFLKKFDFPAEAAEQYTEAYEEILKNEEAGFLFEQQLVIYESDTFFDYYAMLDKVKGAIALADVKEEPAYMAFLICMTKHLHNLYKQRGLSEDLFAGVAFDLKVKNNECYKLRGIHGTFVADWFGRFYNLSRFTIGRLEYEPRYLPEDLDLGDVFLKKGTFCIGIHIPSGAPLTPELCEDSLKRAYDMYHPLFKDNTVIFHCGSWMLAPAHRQLLNPESNLIKFMDMFYRLVETGKTFEHDFWRIFDTEDCSDVSKLKKETSLQKIYAKIIESGNLPQSGKGIIIVKNRKIIK